MSETTATNDEAKVATETTTAAPSSDTTHSADNNSTSSPPNNSDNAENESNTPSANIATDRTTASTPVQASGAPIHLKTTSNSSVPDFAMLPEGTLTMEQICAFFPSSGLTPRTPDRPYLWSNTVMSLDGITSFRQVDADSGKFIAMSHLEMAGASTDWQLLNAGWMLADCVFGTGEILRSETDIVWVPQFKEMLDYRENLLKKTRLPSNAVVTGSGALDFDHVMFHTKGLRVIVFTSTSGEQTLNRLRGDQKFESDVHIEVCNDSESSGRVNYADALRTLKRKYNVETVDVTAGGKTIAAMLYEQLLDEVRITVSGLVCGTFNEQGRSRPSLMPFDAKHSFGLNSHPLFEYAAVRMSGMRHLFLRTIVTYRHHFDEAKSGEPWSFDASKAGDVPDTRRSAHGYGNVPSKKEMLQRLAQDEERKNSTLLISDVASTPPASPLINVTDKLKRPRGNTEDSMARRSQTLGFGLSVSQLRASARGSNTRTSPNTARQSARVTPRHYLLKKKPSFPRNLDSELEAKADQPPSMRVKLLRNKLKELKIRGMPLAGQIGTLTMQLRKVKVPDERRRVETALLSLQSDYAGLQEDVSSVNKAIEQVDLQISQDRIMSMMAENSGEPLPVPHDELNYGNLLGHGSYADVYRGRWNEIKVAIKKLKVSEKRLVGTIKGQSMVHAQFETEVATMRAMPKHDNLLALLGVCGKESDDLRCFLTELMSNGDLAQFVRTTPNEPLDAAVVAHVIRGICDGLHVIHTHGYIHRDIAARNIMLDYDFTPKIGDFGNAIKIADVASDTEEVPPNKWLAPEVCQSKQWSTASDMWALGITIWEVVTRADPYPNVDVVNATMRLHADEEYVPVVEDNEILIEQPVLRAALDRTLLRKAEDRANASSLSTLLYVGVLPEE